MASKSRRPRPSHPQSPLEDNLEPNTLSPPNPLRPPLLPPRPLLHYPLNQSY